jgi:hypothetical protein
MSANKMLALKEARLTAELIDKYRFTLDDETKMTMIEGETDLLTMIDRLLFDIAETEGLSAGVTIAMEEMAVRKKRFGERREKLRELLLHIMQLAEVRSLERPVATLSVRVAPPRVVVVEEGDVPAEFLKVKTEIDKAKINEFMKRGNRVPGCELSNSPETISIRFT